MKTKITKEMKIDEVLQKHPKVIAIFMKHGFHCLGCAAANYEDIESGAKVHGINVDEFIKELNEVIEND